MMPLRLVMAIRRMDECRASCDAGDPFYGDPQAWDTIRAALVAIIDTIAQPAPDKEGE